VGFGRESVHEWPNLAFTNFKVDPPKGVNIREDYLYVVQGFFGEQEKREQNLGVVLRVTSEQQQMIDTILGNPVIATQPRILVCSGANWKNKQLTNDTLMEFLLRVHHALGCSFLFAWGTESEREVAQQIHRKLPGCSLVIPRLPLAALQNLMSKMDLIIAMDSLPLHLAATTSTPTYSVFGPSLASKFKPIGSHHHAYQGSCPYGKTFEKRCSILRTCTTGACMRHLRATPLVDDFLTWWKARRG
jgi:heptosyltransferase-1